MCSLTGFNTFTHDHDQRVNGCPRHQSSHQRLDPVKKMESFDLEDPKPSRERNGVAERSVRD